MTLGILLFGMLTLCGVYYGSAILGIPAAPYFATLLTWEVFDTYLFVALGASAEDLAALLHGEVPNGAEGARDTWLRLALLGVAILASAALVAAIGRLAMKAIDDRRHMKEGVTLT